MTQPKTDNDSIMAEMRNVLNTTGAGYVTITPEGGKYDGLELTLRKVGSGVSDDKVAEAITILEDTYGADCADVDKIAKVLDLLRVKSPEAIE